METKVIEDMCRCCGHHCDELISIDEEVGEKFSLSNTFGKLSTLMAECIHIDVSFDDGLPNRLCLMCVAMLRTVHAFHRMCKENDRKFRKQFTEIRIFDASEDISPKLEFHEERIFSEPLSESVDGESFMNDIENESIFNHEESDNDSVTDPITSNYTKPKKIKKKKSSETFTKNMIKTDSNEDEIIVARAPIVNGRLQCEICEKLLSDRQALKFHIRNHLGIKLHECQICKKGFAKKSNLKTHEFSHLGDKKSLSSIKNEGNESTESKELSERDDESGVKLCKICDQRFVKTNKLMHHMLLHLKEMKSPCEFCITDFDSEQLLQEHIESYHGFSQNVIASTTNFLTHELWGKPNGKKDCKCKLCDRSFRRILELREHIQQHARDREPFNNINESISCLENLSKLSKDDIRSHIQRKIKNNDVENFYEISNERGCELTLSDSETESESEDKKVFYYCEFCDQSFSRRYELVSHMCVDHAAGDELGNWKQHLCIYCNKNFPNADLLRKHIQNHCENDKKKFVCELCSIKFRWKNCFEKHMMMNHINIQQTQRAPRTKVLVGPGNEFQCDICSNAFSTLFSKKRHMSRIHSAPKHNCDICGRVFNRKDHLQRHSLRHTRSKTGEHKCDLCPKKYLRIEHLERHKLNHGNAENEKCFECYVCKKAIKRFDNLRTHMKIFHRREGDPPDDTNKASRLCPHCGRSFNNSSNLSVHIRRHLNERPFKCQFCEKAFSNSSEQKCHERIHTGERPYKCGTCGMGFIKSNQLKRHHLTHTNERPHKCPHCERGFNQPGDLRIHIRRHTGEKPFICNVCGERFIQGTLLKQHQIKRGHTIANQLQNDQNTRDSTLYGQFANSEGFQL